MSDIDPVKLQRVKLAYYGSQLFYKDPFRWRRQRPRCLGRETPEEQSAYDAYCREWSAKNGKPITEL